MLEKSVIHWGDWFVLLLMSKLAYTTRNDWKKSREIIDDFPINDQLMTFLENRARTQDAAQVFSHKNQNTLQTQSTQNFNPKKSSVSAHTTGIRAEQATPNCLQCPQQQHFTRGSEKQLYQQLGAILTVSTQINELTKANQNTIVRRAKVVTTPFCI